MNDTITQPTLVRGTGRPKLYKTEDGTRVPGVTTITGRFKDAGGLVQWAYQQGLAGKDINETRDDAATAGSLAHDLIERRIHGDITAPVETSNIEHAAKALNALAQFDRWIASKAIRFTHTELPLVSELYRFGGTLDAVGIGPGGEVVLVDWKSSNGVYPEYIVQLGGYSLLLLECLAITVSAAVLLRFDKDADVFSEHHWGRSVLDEAEKAFLAQRSLYESDKNFKRWCK